MGSEMCIRGRRMGGVSGEQLPKARPYVIVVAFVIAAIVTPPDVISQTLLAVPLIVLYEVGILVCRVTGSSKVQN